jgi:hypothetical protein
MLERAWVGSRAVLMGAITTVVGCYDWHHAPGYASRHAMVKQELRVETGRLCHFGACDKRGPNGMFRFADVDVRGHGAKRVTTRFAITYGDLRASCSAPGSDPDRPFACAITAPAGAAYQLVLGPGCTSGTMSQVGQLGGWSIQTDTVTIGGSLAPGREVSLIDLAGALAISDALTSDNIDVFSRPGAGLAPAQLLALVAVQAFLEMDDHPPECLGASAA